MIDAYLPGMNGLELLHWLRKSGDRLPALMITGDSDVSLALAAMKAGASDFIEKPIGHGELVASVRQALENSQSAGRVSALRDDAVLRLSRLTPRQREIMTLVLDGRPNKNIATDLHISQRTVENHRASIMHKAAPSLCRP